MSDYYWKTLCEERTVDDDIILTQGFFYSGSAECIVIRLMRIKDHTGSRGEIIPETRIEGMSGG